MEKSDSNQDRGLNDLSGLNPNPPVANPTLDPNRNESPKIWEEKQKIYYSALVSSFVDSKMSKDKGILTLATAAIGFLVTLSDSMPPGFTINLVLFGAAILMFIITIILILRGFELNSQYILAIRQGKDQSFDKALQHNNRWIMLFFVAALFLVLFFAFFNNLQKT